MFFRFLKKVIDKFFVFWVCSVRIFLLRSPFPSTLVYSKRSRGDLFKTAVVELVGVGSSAPGAERVLYQFFVLVFLEKSSLEVLCFCVFGKFRNSARGGTSSLSVVCFGVFGKTFFRSSLFLCFLKKIGFWVVVGLGGGQRGGQRGAQVVRSVQSEVDSELHRWCAAWTVRCTACTASWRGAQRA